MASDDQQMGDIRVIVVVVSGPVPAGSGPLFHSRLTPRRVYASVVTSIELRSEEHHAQRTQFHPDLHCMRPPGPLRRPVHPGTVTT